MKLFSLVSDFIVKISHNLAALFMAIAVILVCYQVFTRFILGDSAAWSEILARGLIIWSVFIASAACFRYGAMISIEVAIRILPQKLQIITHRVVVLLTLTFLGVLVWNGWLITKRVSGQQLAMLDVSIAWFYAALPVGALFACLAVIQRHIALESAHYQHQAKSDSAGLFEEVS